MLTSILSQKYVDPALHVFEAWLAGADGEELCAAHFRADACRARRCKYSHAFSVGIMKDVAYDTTDSGDAWPVEPFVTCYKDLTQVPRAEYSKLNFLFIDGKCIYDHANPDNWSEWNKAFKKPPRELPTTQGSAGLAPIAEIDGHEDTDTITATTERILLGTGDIPTKGLNTAHILDIPAQEMIRMLSFVTDLDLCHLFETCGSINRCIQFDEILNFRRREYLSTVRLTGRDLSKMKKQEKKKKIKAANAKILPKKDPYRV